ncbi:MAG: hypothetical protein ABSC48_18240 [Terracidiphilus sp.]|jgi:hypothetical protein
MKQTKLQLSTADRVVLDALEQGDCGKAFFAKTPQSGDCVDWRALLRETAILESL